MADVTERLDRIEQAVATTNSQLGEVKSELGTVKSEVGTVKSELGAVKSDLGTVKSDLGTVKSELGAVKSELGAVKERLDKHDVRFDSLESAVHQLRLLGEYNTGQIKLVAEVQSRHGEKLDELTKAIEPLKDLRDFVERVANNHERRITALEKGSER